MSVDEQISNPPLVSCIMPTTNRRQFVPLAINYFLNQDYLRKELVIVDDGSDDISDLLPDSPGIRYEKLKQKHSTGSKRNYACEQARGSIIIHWDDDDWMSSWRISYQVNNLLRNKAEICGLDSLLFWDPVQRKSWEYVYPKSNRPWIAGGTLCYTKSLWSRHPFPDITEGEDTRYVFGMGSQKLLALEDNGFYVALVHSGNTSKKRTSGSNWHPFSIEKLREIVTPDWERYDVIFQQRQTGNENAAGERQNLVTGSTIAEPLVSCILPTFNRHKFISQAVKYFLRQSYRNKELIIVDDGVSSVRDLIPNNPAINYIRLSRRLTVGEKRNLACDRASGEIIISWDDDDWYSPERIVTQVKPLINGTADLTGLGNGLFLSLINRQFWAISDRLHERMFSHGIISGTMCFWKHLWSKGTKFEKISMADDARFVNDLQLKGARLEKINHSGIFVYIRHDTNTWRFNTGSYLNSGDWKIVSSPAFIPQEDLEFYSIKQQQDVSRDSAEMVSCILATYGRRNFLKQAIKYFQSQSYTNKELIIVDDGEGKDDEITSDSCIKYIRLKNKTSLGEKLNIGIRASCGSIIQKLDDDDYYHPDFLASAVAALREEDSINSIVGAGCFLVLVARTGELKLSGNGWCAGGTLCFFRELWEKKNFRDEKKAVDWWFLKDHGPKRIKLTNPELYMLVRHDLNHLWRDMNGTDVTRYFQQRQAYDKPLDKLLSAEDYSFYHKLNDAYLAENHRGKKDDGEINMELKTIKAPDHDGREAMYYADKQDYAYQQGAYDYLQSIAMVPRMATIAGYIKNLGLKQVVDIGCGTAELLNYLDGKIKYTGIDISETAIRSAKDRFSSRRNAKFQAIDFRNWDAGGGGYDAFIWAGIGCTWTLKGRSGSANDWLEILDRAEQVIKPEGFLVLELVTKHWTSLECLIEGRYSYEAGCDLVCFQCEESPNRSIRIFKKAVAV